ncbi:MAG: carboxypeptidase regulatory-like domain-containing protein [bacterium]|nr:carboxypeptidase regulatory-like domain-containing protein [bacterium]
MISSLLAPLTLALLGFAQGPTPPKIPAVKVSDGLKQMIEIQTQDGEGSSFRMVPNMRFVVLPLDSGPLADPILEGVTDDEGRALLELPTKAFRTDNTGRFWAHVYLREEGKQTRRAEFLYPGDFGYSSNALSIDVLDGRTTFGRTVDSAGNPVDARLSLREQDGSYIPVGKGETTRYIDLHGGWHLVHHEEPLTISGKVKANGVGTASFQGLELGCPSSRTPFEVVLQGEGVLRGTLFNQSGNPSEGVSLVFTQTSSDTGLPGNVSGSCSTDEDGHFMASGLQPGSYKVQRNSRAVPQATQDLLESLRFETNKGPICLEIPRFHLEVTLLSSDSGPWTGRIVHAGQQLYPFAREASHERKGLDKTKWPEEPTLVVVDAGSKRDAQLAESKRLVGPHSPMIVTRLSSGLGIAIGLASSVATLPCNWRRSPSRKIGLITKFK